ncbi:unnamed protein product [Spodoptera exigua]|nr:unnamed protein product [Spodoptera exigua]
MRNCSSGLVSKECCLRSRPRPPEPAAQYRPARLPDLIVATIQQPCKKLTAHTEYEMFAVNVSLLSEYEEQAAAPSGTNEANTLEGAEEQCSESVKRSFTPSCSYDRWGQIWGSKRYNVPSWNQEMERTKKGMQVI